MVVRRGAIAFALIFFLFGATQPAQAATSLSGTVIPPASQFTDSSGNVWTLVGTSPLLNGNRVAASGIDLLLYYNGSIYAHASAGNWSQWYIFSSGSWAHVADDPRGSSTSHLGQTIPRSLFGMDTLGNWPTVPFGVRGKGGGSVWPQIESSRGVRNWSELDYNVAAARANGVPIIYTFEAVPGWAIAGSSTATCNTFSSGRLWCPQPPDNMADWTNFVTALVARYCPSGVPSIQYYQLWNEPYNVYGTSQVQLSPANLAKMTHAAYGIIRSNCPAAKILSPDFLMDYNAPVYEVSGYTSVGLYSQRYFEALGPVGTDPVDYAAVHMYADDVETGKQLNATPEDLMPPYGALYNSFTAGVFNTYMAGEPIWNVEGSWGGNGNTTLSTTAAGQAAFIARWYILHWAAGYDHATWYMWDHPDVGTLCRPASGGCAPNTVPVEAYKQTYNWLVGKVMYNGCSTASDGVTWTCQLSGPGSYTGLIVWDIAGNRSYTPPSPSQYTQYRDLADNVTPYFGGAVTVGIQPILFEN